MNNFKFDRVVRTSYSEVYYIYEEDHNIGELHIHILKNSPSHFTLIIKEELDQVDENTILEQIDLEFSTDFDVPYYGYYINIYRGNFKEEYEVINEE